MWAIIITILLSFGANIYQYIQQRNQQRWQERKFDSIKAELSSLKEDFRSLEAISERHLVQEEARRIADRLDRLLVGIDDIREERRLAAIRRRLIRLKMRK